MDDGAVDGARRERAVGLEERAGEDLGVLAEVDLVTCRRSRRRRTRPSGSKLSSVRRVICIAASVRHWPVAVPLFGRVDAGVKVDERGA